MSAMVRKVADRADLSQLVPKKIFRPSLGNLGQLRVKTAHQEKKIRNIDFEKKIRGHF